MIIGLHGRLQAGKDTTFLRFRDRCRGLVEVERLSFADPLKDSAAALLGVSREHLDAMKLDPNPCIFVYVESDGFAAEYTGREFLQRYGTESHREVFGDDFWVNQALAKVTDPHKVYVITDCRFENEASAIYQEGGRVVRVIGPEGSTDNHASETPLGDEYIYDSIDNSIRDDGYENLDQQIEDILMPLLNIQGVLA